MRNAVQRLAIVPFESAIALLLGAYGITGLFHIGLIDPVGTLLPHLEAVVLYVMDIVTGVLMITGMATAAGGTEIAGLLFLMAVIIDRGILYGYYLGFGTNFAVTGIFDLAIVWAALTRLSTVRKHQVLVRVQNGRSLDAPGC